MFKYNLCFYLCFESSCTKPPADFIKKGTWSVHSFNGEYLSIPKCTGSCGYLFHEIPSIYTVEHKLLFLKY